MPASPLPVPEPTRLPIGRASLMIVRAARASRIAPRRTAPDDGPVVSLPLEEVRPGVTARLGGVRMAHVAALAELEGDWPPILVTRDHRIIDGHYRYLAARRLQHLEIDCRYFDDDDDAAFVEAVRRNTNHGLPLTVRERRQAAARLLDAHPEWADRRIADACSVSASTVAGIRQAPGRPTGRSDRLDTRIGRDGRARPVDALASRRRIAEALRADPTASLRAVARLVGTSPETVRSVRKHLAAADALGPGPLGPHAPARVSVSAPGATSSTSLRVEADAAFAGSPQLEEFVAWFERTELPDSWQAYVGSVPLSRVYEVADEARRRADRWREFAEAVEARSRPFPRV